jgi:single-strand DNA-binding protein
MSNTLTITGNLTADPELRWTPSGKAVVNFTVADNHFRKNQDGTFEQTGTTFIRCQAWNHLAEQIADRGGKGDKVSVTGTLKQRDYDDRDGNKRTVVELHVDEFARPLPKFPPRDGARTTSGYQQPAPQARNDDPWGNAPQQQDPPF